MHTFSWAMRHARPSGSALFLLLLLPSDAKLQASSVSLGAGQRWGYISKFGYSPGNGNYSLRLRVPPQPGRPVSNTTLRFESYLDEDWDSVLDMEDPCKRKDKARKSWGVSFPSDGQWSMSFPGQVRNSVRSHVWYFVLADCATSELKDKSLRIEYEIFHTNEGGSHFTVETRWSLPSNALSLLCFAAFCGVFANRCKAEMSSVGKLHTVIWALATVVAMQLLAQLLHALHLWRYSYNGSGVRGLEILAECLFIVSQLVQSTLLILIGYGYTLIPVDVEPATVLIVFSLGALVHVVLVLLVKGEDAADKFHDYDGLAGKMLLALRLALFAGFMWALTSTMQGAPFRIRRFLATFGIIGTLYFVGPPLLVLVVSIFAPYWRPPILNSCLILLQIGTAWWLHSLFLSRGEYFEVSDLNSSSLPRGTPRGSPRDSPDRKRD